MAFNPFANFRKYQKIWMAVILLVLGLYVMARFTLGRIRTKTDGAPVRSRFLGPLGC